jgi:hypothetical protein
VKPLLYPFIAELMKTGTLAETESKKDVLRSLSEMIAVTELFYNFDPLITNKENIKKAVGKEMPNLINKILSAA